MKDLKSVKTDVWDVRLGIVIGSTLRKIFRRIFFLSKRLGYVLIVFAMP